jgi:nitrate/nitrite transporter NarK
LFRDDPSQHPWCNAEEVELIHRDWPKLPPGTVISTPKFPWRFLLTNPSLWGNSVMQFMTNVGWLFLGTTLPRYLDEVHHVPVLQRSVLASVPLFAGWFGILLGGPWTDRWTAWKGRKWGRRGPIACSRLLAVGGYLLVLAVMWGAFGSRESLTAIWIAVAGLSLVAVATDLGVPATWAFAQDVGGKHTSAVLGWANMWGNIGAAVFSLFSEMILGKTPGLMHWTWLCSACAAAFAISAVCACLMDASRPVGDDSGHSL